MSKSNKLEIVLLAYHFPPLAGMASNRAARFVNELTERGHRVTVVTGAGDPPLEGPCMTVHDEVRIVRAGRRQLSGGVRAARSALPASVGGTRDQSPEHGGREQRMRRWVRDWIYVPDAQIAWFPAALRACRRELADMSDPLLWTTSVPYTCHLVGAALQRRTGVRWVAEFRDPWAHAQDVGLRSPRRTAIDRRMERSVVRRPDVLLFTTDETLDLFSSDHGDSIRNRAHVVPNTWRRSDFLEPDPPDPDEPLRLVYAGSINEVQDPGPLVEAVDNVSSESDGGVELHVFGESRGWRVGHASHLHGPVAPETVPQTLSSASAVVMLAPGADYLPILLGKTMDWLGSGQPCLGIVNPDGAMAGLIEQAHGGVVCATNEVDDVEAAIRLLLDAHRNGELDQLRPDPCSAQRFELSAVADRLIVALTSPRVPE